MASIIPLDIITDILCRLPVEELLRFRSVSKPWCSLIDSPNFIKLHLSHSLKTQTNLSLILKDSDFYSVNLDSLQTAQKINHAPDGKQTQILGSCNGLLALLNPNDKIVQFLGKGDESFSSEVKVYSLKTNSWRRVKDFPFCVKYEGDPGILVSNALHWVASKKSGFLGKSFVVAFDLGTEDYHRVHLPDFLDEGIQLDVAVFQDCLIVNHWEIFSVDIWMMKKYGVKESWTKFVTLENFGQTIPSFHLALPLAYSERGDQVLLKLNMDCDKLFWYDLARKRVKHVTIRGWFLVEGVSFSVIVRARKERGYEVIEELAMHNR
ncbi:hypothetical protein COLO4_06128 [Corchorus olitorius]|uniref:F-box domain-containing protein n=1 Tax=Corchorus olitorius TaxID=93759 RepID=A0A1R3KNX6_9ROSI|nr:hypothetical protein COLO4_06128 [Corchorus olitorius]